MGYLDKTIMPTYEYLCQKCGYQFDYFQSMTEASLKRCPLCSGKVERLISAGAGVIFKGSGFYITDYTRSEDYKKKSKEEKSGGTITPSGDNTKKEKNKTVKPETKSSDLSKSEK